MVQSGVTSERVTLATCWRTAVDESEQLTPPSGTPCSDVVVSVTHPTEVVPFDQVDVRSSTATEESS